MHFSSPQGNCLGHSKCRMLLSEAVNSRSTRSARYTRRPLRQLGRWSHGQGNSYTREGDGRIADLEDQENPQLLQPRTYCLFGRNNTCACFGSCSVPSKQSGFFKVASCESGSSPVRQQNSDHPRRKKSNLVSLTLNDKAGTDFSNCNYCQQEAGRIAPSCRGSDLSNHKKLAGPEYAR